MHDATEGDVNVQRHFVWILLDNFEWAFGYSRRFGSVGVDFSSGERLAKESSYRNRDTFHSNLVQYATSVGRLVRHR